MRIGFDAKRAFHNRTGLGNYSRTIIADLSRRFPNHEYSLYTPDAPRAFADGLANVRVSTPRTILGRALPSLWRSFLLAGDLKKDRIDVFHGLSNELPLGLRRAGVKSAATIHDLIFLRYPRFYPLADRTAYEWKSRHACSAADKIVAVSRQTKKDIVEFFGVNEGKISVVYQSCDPIFREKVSAERKEAVKAKYTLPRDYILYVGTVEKRKNLLSLVKGILLLKPKLDVPLVVVGRGASYLREVSDFIRRQDLEKNVLFLNAVSLEDLPPLYQQARLFVYPSLFEGFGIPILEALSGGTPVVTSRGSCFEEAGGPDSLYVDPLDVEELAATMEKAITDGALRERMIRGGYAHAETFRPEKASTALMDIYTSLIAN